MPCEEKARYFTMMSKDVGGLLTDSPVVRRKEPRSRVLQKWGGTNASGRALLKAGLGNGDSEDGSC